MQKYLKAIVDFDQLRSRETTSKPSEMLYSLLNLNSMYQNMLDCIDILTKYSENIILAENIRFHNESTNNRKKVLYVNRQGVE